MDKIDKIYQYPPHLFFNSSPARPGVTNLTNLSNGPKATTALNMKKGAKFTIVCTIFLRIGLNSKS